MDAEVRLDSLTERQAALAHRALHMAREAYLKCSEQQARLEELALNQGDAEDPADIDLADLVGLKACCSPMHKDAQESRRWKALIVAREAFLKRMRMCELDFQARRKGRDRM